MFCNDILRGAMCSVIPLEIVSSVTNSANLVRLQLTEFCMVGQIIH